jgi:hypothetical protein
MTVVGESASEVPESAARSTADPTTSPPGDVITVRRRVVDELLIALGVVVTIVLFIAGALLTWGANFASDHVHDELTAQRIFFPDAASLTEEGRDDLVKYAEQQVTSGGEANAYASYIGGHLEGIGEGQTYAELGDPFFAAQAELESMQESGASDAAIAEQQGTVDEISRTRDTLFKGETLRGLLLTTYAWDTIGRIASIAAIAAFGAAAVMLVLVILGVVHLYRTRKATSTTA